MNLGLRAAIEPDAFDELGTSLAIASTRCRTAALRSVRIPAVFHASRPPALFLPDILTDLPQARRSAMPLAQLFDVTVCELPGHGASEQVADISLAGFACEYATLIDRQLSPGRRLTMIGEGFGGLLALEVARLRPERVGHVILLDTPVLLTRPVVASRLAAQWRRDPSPYRRRVLEDVLGVDPARGVAQFQTLFCDLVEDIDFGCTVLAGAQAASMLTDEDLSALHAANDALLIAPRIARAGHRVLEEDPEGCMATLGRVLAAA